MYFRTLVAAFVAAFVAALSAVATAPSVHANPTVVYEVRSTQVSTANIAYTDISGEHVLQNVPLPWRVHVPVVDAHGAGTTLRAEWEDQSGRYKWVTIRIFTVGSLLCENTLDLGEASCDGRGAYADELPRF